MSQLLYHISIKFSQSLWYQNCSQIPKSRKGHSKNNEATKKYCMQAIYSAVMAYRKNDVEMYQR